MSGHSVRAGRALAHLGEVDPALAVLALWCRHRDGTGATRTEGDVIHFGPGFDHMPLPEQLGLLAHHVLHVALRHSNRQAALAERLGARFDASLYGLAADGIINETLILAGHALPRPAVTLCDLLDEAGMPAKSPVEALGDWDADRLAMALHAEPKRAEKLREWGRTRGFARDLEVGAPDEEGESQTAADWRNQILRALEAGRKSGSGIGKLGAILADLAPARVPWEVQLRGILARALTERPRRSYRRPAGRWLAMAEHARVGGGPAPVFEPGRVRHDMRPRVVIGLDTSSSVDRQTLSLFCAEAEGITRRSGAEVHLLAFDEAVFTQARLDPNGWQALRAPEFRTGGGTDFTPFFEAASALQPSIAVVLSDLDAPMPAPPRYPVIWAVPGRVSAPPFGRVVTLADS